VGLHVLVDLSKIIRPWIAEFRSVFPSSDEPFWSDPRARPTSKSAYAVVLLRSMQFRLAPVCDTRNRNLSAYANCPLGVPLASECRLVAKGKDAPLAPPPVSWNLDSAANRWPTIRDLYRQKVNCNSSLIAANVTWTVFLVSRCMGQISRKIASGKDPGYSPRLKRAPNSGKPD
jgi:hypothetical protein